MSIAKIPETVDGGYTLRRSSTLEEWEALARISGGYERDRCGDFVKT